MKTFSIGGIHPKASKLTDKSPITDIAVPERLTIVLNQSIGKPSKPLVKVGDEVAAYDKIAEADGVMSANLHAPVAGKVVKLEKVHTGQGYWADAIILQTLPEREATLPEPRSIEEIRALSGKEIVEIVREAGIVGLGGACFPTAVKLTPPPGFTPDVIVINGAECEPYLTCDDLLMQTHAEEVVKGAMLLMHAVGVNKIVIGIEENKPAAIAAMRQAAIPYPEIKVEVLKKKYPQGGEKELIEALLRKQVPSGGLPVAVGAIVDNVATAYAVYEAVTLHKPLTHRVVTVTGPSVASPGNFRVPIGTDLSELITMAGGLPEDTGKVVAGGPMMGRAVSCLDTSSTKGLSGVLMLPEKLSHRRREQACIRCGSCVHGCPMGLEPHLLIALARAGRWEDMKANLAMNCIECGSCSYVCPASKPLLDFIKLGKQEIRRQKL